ncbi:hypothetical protein HKK55_09420 [Pseudomonas sp. ADAK18]|uniref:hypothetical protein n=1 Tax=Pseudomonas sp. ADAK18 TaxID=2730848 RepID=UPI001462DFA0|nr:hypothetical protein [Pseudomonas sp. ADAK18]QJI28925.1 hypothetical protein HKK55_09420 [Pseudomonas sp. ADAK18]
MSDVERLTQQGVGASERKGFWVHAGDFNQKIEQGQAREAYLAGEIEKWTALSGENFKRAQILRLERDALQQLLNQRDEQIETLKQQPRATLANAPLVYGSLDAAQRLGLCLCRGEPAPVAVVLPEQLIAAIEAEQERLSQENYLMDSEDCVKVSRATARRD